ncbi:MAG: DUF5684 domain-containing protein [Aristaeellaceae bacterium]
MYNSNYYYSASAYEGMSVLSSVISLAVMVISIVALWKILVKANEPGWKCLIPLYNTYTLFKISWKTNMFWVMLGLAIGAPLLGSLMIAMDLLAAFAALLMIAAVIAAMVIVIIMNVKLAKAFGRSGAFAVGLVLLGVIFQCILAFGSDKYIGPQA